MGVFVNCDFNNTNLVYLHSHSMCTFWASELFTWNILSAKLFIKFLFSLFLQKTFYWSHGQLSVRVRPVDNFFYQDNHKLPLERRQTSEPISGIYSERKKTFAACRTLSLFVCTRLIKSISHHAEEEEKVWNLNNT